MATTDLYRKQHADLVNLVGQIVTKLDAGKLKGADAAPTADLLKALAGKLIIHLAAEDQQLYPKMAKSSDKIVAATAKRFQQEMGGLKAAFEAYYGKWSMAKAIQSDPPGFIAATKGVFDALGKRVQRENTELYPLADKM